MNSRTDPAPPSFGDLLAGSAVAAERRAWFRRVLGESKRRAGLRRERVLRYEDLAAQLCAPVIGYAFPEQWNGMVPPGTGQVQYPDQVWSAGRPERRGHPAEHGRVVGAVSPTELNTSPRRAALVAVCAEARRRDIEAGLISGDPDPGILELYPMPGQLAPEPEAEPPVSPVQAELGGWGPGSNGEAYS